MAVDIIVFGVINLPLSNNLDFQSVFFIGFSMLSTPTEKFFCIAGNIRKYEMKCSQVNGMILGVVMCRARRSFGSLSTWDIL